MVDKRGNIHKTYLHKQNKTYLLYAEAHSTFPTRQNIGVLAVVEK